MNGVIEWFPGREPEEIRKKLEELFAMLDEAFPDRVILWYQWDHEKWDRLAGWLCHTLGYSRGLYFLTNYGYTVNTEMPLSAQEKGVTHHGRIVKILKYNRSGFIHCDEDGKDYYFSIRNFTEKVKLLEKDRETEFRLAERVDSKTGEPKLCAVQIKYT